jgi:nitroimidazol reductase NimA-like FMN-containing flavoprotein (pyridoxamine 5'-phosphate oxidase superfamily)
MQAMRRKDRQITDEKALKAIMEEAQVCRLGLSDEGTPYVVPMNFGLGENCLYFHCAREGRKLDILRKNDRVCFEMDILHKVYRHEVACGCSTRFDSVIGVGRARLVEDPEQKRLALDRIMEHYGYAGPFTFPEEMLARTAVIRVSIESLSGKHHD